MTHTGLRLTSFEKIYILFLRRRFVLKYITQNIKLTTELTLLNNYKCSTARILIFSYYNHTKLYIFIFFNVNLVSMFMLISLLSK